MIGKTMLTTYKYIKYELEHKIYYSIHYIFIPSMNPFLVRIRRFPLHCGCLTTRPHHRKLLTYSTVQMLYIILTNILHFPQNFAKYFSRRYFQHPGSLSGNGLNLLLARVCRWARTTVFVLIPPCRLSPSYDLPSRKVVAQQNVGLLM